MTALGGPARYEAIRRLLHIGAFEPGTPLADQITMGFVERALWSLPSDESYSPSEISSAIEADFGLRFEPAEIRHVLRSVSKRRGRRISHSGRRDPKYNLTPEHRRALEQAIEEADRLEGRVMDAWHIHLQEQYPSLTDQELSRLLTDQQAFNRQVLLRYGAQTQALLGAGPPPSEGKLAPTIEGIFSSLPPVDQHLMGMRRETLTAFWLDAEGDRALYLTRLLDNACIVHTAHIDPKCSLSGAFSRAPSSTLTRTSCTVCSTCRAPSTSSRSGRSQMLSDRLGASSLSRRERSRSCGHRCGRTLSGSGRILLRHAHSPLLPPGPHRSKTSSASTMTSTAYGGQRR